MYIFVPDTRTKYNMSETTKKRIIYNGEILIRLKKKYGVSQRFITMSLNGDRESETSKTICADYEIMLEKVIELLNTL